MHEGSGSEEPQNLPAPTGGGAAAYFGIPAAQFAALPAASRHWHEEIAGRLQAREQREAAAAIQRRDLAALAGRPTAEDRLVPEEIDWIKQGMPPNTRATYLSTWMRVVRWTGEQGYTEVPMTPATCVRWIMANSRMTTGRYGRPPAPTTVELSLAVITKAHEAARRIDPVTGQEIRGYVSPVRDPEVRLAMRQYRREWIDAGYRPDVASPLMREELVELVATCDLRSPVGVRDALALCVGYDMGTRAGELTAINWEDVHPYVPDLPIEHWRQWLNPERTPLSTEDDYLLIYVPRSKTDQEGHGAEVFLPAHPAHQADTCPVRLTLAWHALLQERGIEARGPLVRELAYGNKPPKDGSPRKARILDSRVEWHGLNRLWRRAVAAAGIADAGSVNRLANRPAPKRGRGHRPLVLHSMRAGAATNAAMRGADVPELNRHFRWSSRGNTAARYAARAASHRQNPARRIWQDDDAQ